MANDDARRVARASRDRGTPGQRSATVPTRRAFVVPGLLVLVVAILAMTAAMDMASDDSPNWVGTSHERQKVTAALSASTSPA
jgi:hypothetical protein